MVVGLFFFVLMSFYGKLLCREVISVMCVIYLEILDYLGFRGVPLKFLVDV